MSASPARPASEASYQSSSSAASLPDPSSLTSFPHFTDGDVYITLSPLHTYQLHSTHLRENSAFFRGLLSEDAALPKPRKRVFRTKPKVAGENGVTEQEAEEYRLQQQKREREAAAAAAVRFKVVLEREKEKVRHGARKEEEGDVPEGPGKFVLEDPTNTMAIMGIAFHGERKEAPIFNFYDNIFRSYYNLPLKLNQKNMAVILSETVGLVRVAKPLGSIEAIAETVDITLMRQGQALFKGIVERPMQWAELGLELHSPVIFREAVIHTVGKWNMFTEQDKKKLSKSVRELCEAKHTELLAKKKKIEQRISAHYPIDCRHMPAQAQRRGEVPHRPHYSGGIYGWLAIAAFRHWWSAILIEGRHRVAPDGGAWLYRAIGASGRAYLDYRTLAGFLGVFPMTDKGTTLLELTVSTMKNEIKGFVDELLVHRSLIDMRAHPVKHLTCCLVNFSEFPWIKEGAAAAAEVSEEEDLEGMAELEANLRVDLDDM